MEYLAQDLVVELRELLATSEDSMNSGPKEFKALCLALERRVLELAACVTAKASSSSPNAGTGSNTPAQASRSPSAAVSCGAAGDPNTQQHFLPASMVAISTQIINFGGLSLLSSILSVKRKRGVNEEGDVAQKEEDGDQAPFLFPEWLRLEVIYSIVIVANMPARELELVPEEAHFHHESSLRRQRATDKRDSSASDFDSSSSFSSVEELSCSSPDTNGDTGEEKQQKSGQQEEGTTTTAECKRDFIDPAAFEDSALNGSKAEEEERAALMSNAAIDTAAQVKPSSPSRFRNLSRVVESENCQVLEYTWTAQLVSTLCRLLSTTMERWESISRAKFSKSIELARGITHGYRALMLLLGTSHSLETGLVCHRSKHHRKSKAASHDDWQYTVFPLKFTGSSPILQGAATKLRGEGTQEDECTPRLILAELIQLSACGEGLVSACIKFLETTTFDASLEKSHSGLSTLLAAFVLDFLANFVCIADNVTFNAVLHGSSLGNLISVTMRAMRSSATMLSPFEARLTSTIFLRLGLLASPPALVAPTIEPPMRMWAGAALREAVSCFIEGNEGVEAAVAMLAHFCIVLPQHCEQHSSSSLPSATHAPREIIFPEAVGMATVLCVLMALTSIGEGSNKNVGSGPAAEMLWRKGIEASTAARVGTSVSFSSASHILPMLRTAFAMALGTVHETALRIIFNTTDIACSGNSTHRAPNHRAIVAPILRLSICNNLFMVMSTAATVNSTKRRHFSSESENLNVSWVLEAEATESAKTISVAALVTSATQSIQREADVVVVVRERNATTKGGPVVKAKKLMKRQRRTDGIAQSFGVPLSHCLVHNAPLLLVSKEKEKSENNDASKSDNSSFQVANYRATFEITLLEDSDRSSRAKVTQYSVPDPAFGIIVAATDGDSCSVLPKEANAVGKSPLPPPRKIGLPQQQRSRDVSPSRETPFQMQRQSQTTSSGVPPSFTSEKKGNCSEPLHQQPPQMPSFSEAERKELEELRAKIAKMQSCNDQEDHNRLDLVEQVNKLRAELTFLQDQTIEPLQEELQKARASADKAQHDALAARSALKQLAQENQKLSEIIRIQRNEMASLSKMMGS